MTTPYTAHPLAFPNVKRFAELFDQVEVVPLHKTTLRPLTLRRPDWRAFGKKTSRRTPLVDVPIGPYCGIHGRDGFAHIYVHPAPAVAAFLEENWMGDSTGCFRVTVRDDGTALVTAEYDRIIGSHWLALVDASTVPGGA